MQALRTQFVLRDGEMAQTVIPVAKSEAFHITRVPLGCGKLILGESGSYTVTPGVCLSGRLGAHT